MGIRVWVLEYGYQSIGIRAWVLEYGYQSIGLVTNNELASETVNSRFTQLSGEKKYNY